MGNDGEELKNLSARFESTVAKFGIETFTARADERCFQGWLMVWLANEFGHSRVYRELHLPKAELFEDIGDSPLVARLQLREGQKKGVLAPDAAISWAAGVDARTSQSRAEPYRSVGGMLSQFAIISEIKVAGGGKSQGGGLPAFKRDLVKLAVIARAHARSSAGAPKGLATFAILLDNAEGALRHGSGDMSVESLCEELKNLRAQWGPDWPVPTILLVHRAGDRIRTDAIADFGEGSVRRV